MSKSISQGLYTFLNLDTDSSQDKALSAVPSDLSKCKPCGQNALCCPVAEGTTGTTTSEADCCDDSCTYSYQCGENGVVTLVKGSPPNSWSSVDQTLCYSCKNGTCAPVDAGSKGTYHDSACDSKCVTYYTCASDGSGNVVQSPGNVPTTYTDKTKVPCYKCGSNGSCVPVSSGIGDYLPGQCLCYDCNEQTKGFCQPVPEGEKGTASSSSSCTGCSPSLYSCNADGSLKPDPTGVPQPSCWSCIGGQCKPAGGGIHGQYPSKDACQCFTCSPNGCCDTVPNYGKGNVTNCDTCNPKFWACDPTTQSVQPSCTSGLTTKPNCFKCAPNGTCVFVTDGTGTSPTSSCGSGCWTCLPNSVTPSPKALAKGAPLNVKPCEMSSEGQCCPNGYVCAGKSCCKEGTCVDRAGKSTPDCCQSGYDCKNGKCVKKKSFPGWAIAVIVVCILMAIAAGVGAWIHRRLKKAKSQPTEARVVSSDGVTTFET